MSDNDNKDALPAPLDKSQAQTAPRRAVGLIATLALLLALAAAGGAGWQAGLQDRHLLWPPRRLGGGV